MMFVDFSAYMNDLLRHSIPWWDSLMELQTFFLFFPRFSSAPKMAFPVGKDSEALDWPSILGKSSYRYSLQDKFFFLIQPFSPNLWLFFE